MEDPSADRIEDLVADLRGERLAPRIADGESRRL
jgi:hypothetical protein